MYGFILYGANGRVLLDEASLSASIKAVIPVAAGASGSVAYPDLVGRALSVVSVSSTLVFDYRNGNGSIAAVRATASVSYPGGVPTLSWSFSQAVSTDVFVDTTLFVFAK